MANEAFETERERIRGESPKSVLGISPAERWGSAAGALASALVAHRMGRSPIAAGVQAYGGGIKGAIGRRADELSAQYKKSQMRNEQDRMAASLTKPTSSTRIEGEEVVSQRYTTAGGMEDVGRGPRFSPTAKVGEDGRTKKIVSSQIKMVKDEISTILTKHKGAAGFSIPEGFDKLDMMAQFQIMQKTSKDVLGYLKNTQTPQAQRDFATLSKRYGQLTSLVNRGLGVEGEADTPEWERYAQ